MLTITLTDGVLSVWHSVGRSNDDGAGHKAALLSGPPGIGKTTTAQIVCQVSYIHISRNSSFCLFYNNELLKIEDCINSQWANSMPVAGIFSYFIFVGDIYGVMILKHLHALLHVQKNVPSSLK